MTYEVFTPFQKLLEAEKKDLAVQYALDLLENKKFSIEALYQELLAPALLSFQCVVDDLDICIWKEHLRTSIIRTIIECSYPYIMKRLDKTQKKQVKIVVLTPAFEYHEIGAIMIANYFLLEGFDASYIGANTPKDEILSAIRAYEPDFVAMSVTNPYNLVITKQITEEIKRFFPQVGIILGGQAFVNQQANSALTYDYIMQSFDDIKAFGKQVKP
ncbi:MAG: cobalamin B12-binding domain-containing protein [Acholeplasmataceae bacterium]|nr:cobalamin B12-binding domain-containing protein [Acholeplasmataceae bacterium]